MKAWSGVVWTLCAAMVTAAAACDPQTAATRTAAPTPVNDSTSAALTSEPKPAGGPSVSAPIASKPSAAPPLIDFATLANDAPTLDGKRVRVIGDVFEGGFTLTSDPGEAPTLSVPSRSCTELECSPASPCCNRCGSAVSLRGTPFIGVRLVDKSDPRRFVCGGNECSMTCTPAKGGRYEAVGTFRFGPRGELDLEVETITPVP